MRRKRLGWLIALPVLGLLGPEALAGQTSPPEVSIWSATVRGSCETGFVIEVEGCARSQECTCKVGGEFNDTATIINGMYYAVDNGGWQSLPGGSWWERRGDGQCDPGCHPTCHDCVQNAQARGYYFSFSVPLAGLSPGRHTLYVKADSGGAPNSCDPASAQTSVTFDVPDCSGGGGGRRCTSDDQCGTCARCVNGECVQCPYCCNNACSDTPCPPPPPPEWDAVVEVRGPRPWYPPLPMDPNKRRRTPLSFRLWDPAAGYVFEGDRRCSDTQKLYTVTPTACWSRPWAVPDMADNPVGIVRTHRLRLGEPRTVYVQTECGREFNYVLNPAKAAAAYPGGGSSGVTFDPTRGFRITLDKNACPEWVHVCADGTVCGPSCPPGSPPWVCRASCPDGSECKQACRWTVDLGDLYERRETPSWCYEDTKNDAACTRQGDPSSCTSTRTDPSLARPSGAVDDWRVSSPWCWEQSYDGTYNRPAGQRSLYNITQPVSFGTKDGTAETDRCYGEPQTPTSPSPRRP